MAFYIVTSVKSTTILTTYLPSFVCIKYLLNIFFRINKQQCYINRPRISGNMFLRKIISNAKRLYCRAMSSNRPLVDLAVGNDGITIMTLQRPPVNNINLDLLQDMNKALDEIEKTESKGLIITSSSPTVFSSGLDIREIYKPDMKRAETFWRTLQEVYLRLFTSNIITATAINGHAPAGGCLISISTEYRVMVKGESRIGFNETALGIIAPRWFIDALCHTMPVRQVELALTTGRLFKPEEALKVGLIDELAIDKDDAIAKCKSFIRKFDDISPFCRTLSKERIREGVVKRFQERRELDVEEFLAFVRDPDLQKNLEKYIEMLKKKNIIKN